LLYIVFIRGGLMRVRNDNLANGPSFVLPFWDIANWNETGDLDVTSTTFRHTTATPGELLRRG